MLHVRWWKYQVEHSKMKFIFTRRHVISFIYYFVIGLDNSSDKINVKRNATFLRVTETRFGGHTLRNIQNDDDNFAIVVLSLSQSITQSDRLIQTNTQTVRLSVNGQLSY